MEVDNQKLAKSRGGATIEKSAGPTGVSGLYLHKESGMEIASKFDPLYGDVQSEALISMGYERVSDTPEGYAKELVPGSVEAEERDARKGASIGQVKGIEARLDLMENKNLELETENVRLKQQLAEPATEGFPGQEKTKQDALESLTNRNSTDLRNIAEVEGVELTDEHNTNAKLRDAIESKREADSQEGQE